MFAACSNHELCPFPMLLVSIRVYHSLISVIQVTMCQPCPQISRLAFPKRYSNPIPNPKPLPLSRRKSQYSIPSHLSAHQTFPSPRHRRRKHSSNNPRRSFSSHFLFFPSQLFSFTVLDPTFVSLGDAILHCRCLGNED
jgi:hypothetical protein